MIAGKFATWRGALAGAALALVAPLALAAPPSITAADTTAANTFLGDLDGMITRQRSEAGLHLANATNGTSDVIWFDPLKDRSNAYGYTRITYADAEWMRSNVRLYEIYEQLGGNSIGKEQQFRVGAQGFYVGLDGAGGRWFASNSDAQGYLFKLLIAASSEILPAVKDAVGQLASNDIGSVLQSARDAMAANRTFVARGSNNTLIIRGANFGTGGVAPKVVIPSGVTIGQITYDSTEQITVPIAVASDAALGDRRVLLYNPGEALVPIAEFRLVVVRGDGTPTGTGDDVGDSIAAATTLTVGVAQPGRIDGSTDLDVFKIVVPTAGTLVLESSGTTDLVGELLDASGALVVGNDDGGTWYNFRIQQAVGAGVYYLRVRHCCSGGGSYAVSSSLQ